LDIDDLRTAYEIGQALDPDEALELLRQDNAALRQDLLRLQTDNARLRERLAWVKVRLARTISIDYITQGEMLSDIALVRAVLSDPLDT